MGINYYKYTMAEPQKVVVPVEQVVVAMTYQLEALINVLERNGFLDRKEVVEEIIRLKGVTKL